MLPVCSMVKAFDNAQITHQPNSASLLQTYMIL